MSVWPEEQTLEAFIGESDLGKDMYIAGIPRGTPEYIINESTTVFGNPRTVTKTIIDLENVHGVLSSAHLSVGGGQNGNSGNRFSGKMDIYIDDVLEKTLSVNLNNYYGSVSDGFSVNTDNVFSERPWPGSGVNLVFNLYPQFSKLKVDVSITKTNSSVLDSSGVYDYSLSYALFDKIGGVI